MQFAKEIALLRSSVNSQKNDLAKTKTDLQEVKKENTKLCWKELDEIKKRTAKNETEIEELYGLVTYMA